MSPRRLTLVRHGETTGQSSIRYYGRTDLPLSRLGRLQMRQAGDALRSERFDAVLTSRLQRAREGAALVIGTEALSTTVPGFDEVDFGEWEGWTLQEIADRDPENFRRWRADSRSFTYPGGEARPAFEARVRRALDELLASVSAANVLMVLHRGVIAVILTHLLGLDGEQRAQLGIDLGSIHVVGRSGAGWTAEQLDRVDHLPNEQEAPA